jgi:molybdate transport system ATP-binding protein
MTLAAAVDVRLGTLDLHVELRGEPGEVIAMLGPNGAGKTTLLRALAGLQPIDAGRIELDGRVLDDPAAGILVTADARSAGYVFQDYQLFPHLTALENVAFGLRVRRDRHADERAAAWLRRVGLEEHARAKPRALSGGQAQRVALARALATEPSLLLLDEPLAALDATSKVSLRRQLNEHLAGYAGVAVLVTHDAVDAAALADTVVVLEAGRVSQRGTVAQITARPRSRYVADLVGGNLWRGVAGGGGVMVGTVEIAAATETTGDVFALLHPRAVALFNEPPHGSPRNVWPGRAIAVEAVGGGVRVLIDSRLPIVAEVTPAAVAELGIAAGAELWLSFKATEVEVYPA